MRAQSIFMSPTPTKVAKIWEIIFFFNQQLRHLLEASELSQVFDGKMPNIGPQVSAELSGFKVAHSKYLLL